MRALLIGLLLFAVAAHAELSVDEFGYGIELQPRAPAPAYQLDVPEAVYRQVSRADLGDVRVFNAAGEAVPYDLYRPSAGHRTPIEALTLFPLPEPEPTVTGNLSLRVEQGEGSRQLQLSLPGPVPDQVYRRYLVMTAAVPETPPVLQALLLSWQTENNGLYRVDVAISDDLQHWQTQVNQATVAELAFAGQQLRQPRIALPGRLRSRYLLLTVFGDRQPVVTGVRGEWPTETVGPALHWTAVTVTDTDQSADLRFDSPGRFTVEAIRIGFGRNNTLAQGTLRSRVADDQPWRFRARGMLYRIDQGDNTLVDDQLDISTGTDGHWQLQFDRPVGPVTVELGWRPHSLIFMAQGEGPYTLAYGSSRAESAAVPARSLLNQIDREQSRSLISEAIEVGKPRPLAGPTALQPHFEINTLTVLLWATLVIGVALLGIIAWRLWQEMNRPDSGSGG